MTTRLDRKSPLPLWAQVEGHLRRRLAGGEFDTAFPTEAQLTDEFEVSRQTIRQALGRLERDGLLERHRGRGTTVAGAELEQPLRSLYGLARSIEAVGLSEHSEVLTRSVRRAPDAAAALNLPPGDRVVFIERLRFAGSEPLALDRSWLPAAIARPLLHVDLRRGSLYAALNEHCDTRVTGGSERISAVLPSREERLLLRMSTKQAALLVERLALAGEQPVEVRRSVIRGDRYSFRSEWQGGQTNF